MSWAAGTVFDFTRYFYYNILLRSCTNFLNKNWSQAAYTCSTIQKDFFGEQSSRAKLTKLHEQLSD